MPQNQPWCQRFPKDELSGTDRVLTCEEYGFYQRLRDFSFVNGGLPDNEIFLLNLAQTFRLSKYKFRKIWPAVKNFFELREGIFTHPEDEEKRTQRLVIVAKRKIAGGIGAASRWGEESAAAPDAAGAPMANAIANAIPPGMANDGYPQPQPHSDVEDPPTPTPPPGAHGGGGQPPHPITQTQEPQSDSLQPAFDKAEYGAICERALALGMSVPGWKLARKVREKFFHTPIEQVIPLLVVFPGQQHVGLWGQKSAADFELEAIRQAHGGTGAPKKPTGREQQQKRLLDWAREKDAAAGRG